MPENKNPETIFNQALERTGSADCQAYLDEACGDDDDLQAQVKALLDAHREAGDFMEGVPLSPEVEAELSRLKPEEKGDQIDRYKLLQEIGEGGFGVVWMAQQTEPVSRKVALKVIKLGMDTREVIARFEAERQALALMDHPNIARIFDGGATALGRPYFVMELVKGVPLTDYCRDKDLDTKARLELFIDVCAAVQHAHQKGVIHRDLKPSNIMVSPHDGKPVVKVIDFGIAKAISMELTEKTVFTQMGRMIGTPQYMSPEQAELNALDVDTRSDIYSLGVVLYELLTGTTPLDGEQLRSAAYGEMQRLIREETPPKPSTRVSTFSKPSVANHAPDSRALRGDLDWVVMKALEKERERRYETPIALAQDIGRHLRNEPVSAGPPSAIYRMRKFVRRNRRGLLSGALAGAALLTGLAVAAGIWMDSNVEKGNRVARAGELIGQAETHWEKNITGEYDDDDHFLQARGLVRQVGELLTGVNGSGNSVQQRQAKLAAAIDAEERDRRFVTGIQEALMEGASLVGGHKASVEGIVQAFHGIGMDPGGQPARETVEGIMRRREPVREWMMIGLLSWAESLDEKDADKASRLKAIVRKCDLDPWKERLLGVLENPDRAGFEKLADAPELIERPIMTVLWLSLSLLHPDFLDTTEKILRQAQRAAPAEFWTNYFLGMTLAMAGAEITTADDGKKMIRIVTNLDIGSTPGTDSQLKEMAPAMADAISFLRAATAARPDAATPWMALGVLVSSIGHGSDAIACFEQAAELDPGNLTTLEFLGMALLTEERYEEALAVGRHMVNLDPTGQKNYSPVIAALANLGRDDEAYAACQRMIELGLDGGGAYSTLGSIQMMNGDTEKALASFRLGLEANPNMAGLHANIGMALSARGEFAASMASYDEAIRLSPDLASAHNGRGLALMQQGGRKAMAKAIDSFHRVIKLDPTDAQTHSNLGAAFMQMGDYEAAIIPLKEAIALSPRYAMAWVNLGSVYDRLDRKEEAIAAFKKAIEADPNYATGHNNLGLILFEAGRYQEAVEAYQGSKDPAAHLGLGVNLESLGMLGEAINAYKRAIELKPDDAEALNKLALAYLKAGHGEESLPVLEKLLAIFRKGLEKEEGGPESLGDLAAYYSTRGRPEEALTLGETLLSKAAKDHGKEAPETLQAMEVVAGLHMQAGRLDEGFKLLESRLAIRKKAHGAEDPVTLGAMTELAITYKWAGRRKEAIEMQEEALKIMRRVHPENHGLLLPALENLMGLYGRGERGKDTLMLQQEALRLSRTVRGEEDEQTLGHMTNLAIALAGAGRLDEAVAMEEKALGIKRRVLPKDHPFLGNAMGMMADLYFEKGKIPEALALYEELLALRRREFGPANDDTTSTMEDFIQACVRSERLEEGAKALSEHLEHLRRAGQGPDSEIQVHFRGMLGNMADQQTAGLIQPEEIARYYSENKNSFRETSVHLHMITVLREQQGEAREAQRKEVEAWRDKIANGTPFAEIAKLHSADPYKDEGGDRGKVVRGQTMFDGHLDKAIFGAEPGIPVIHESEKILWILKVEDRKEGQVAPLEQVRDEIKGILAKPLREKLLAEWIEEGRKRNKP